jgi:hypothetical protein
MKNLPQHVTQLAKIIGLRGQAIPLQAHLDNIPPAKGNESEIIALHSHRAIMPATAAAANCCIP